jgi:ATP-dependent protease ClpP protease subunit
MLAGEIEALSTSLTATAWILFIFYILQFTLLTWSYVGTWRSASKYSADKKPIAWSILAKFAIVSGVIQISSAFVIQEAPILKVFSPYLLGADAKQLIKIDVLDEGRTLKLSGMFGNGSYNVVKKSLDTNPEIKKIYLDSNGGLYKEVSLIAETILTKRIDTYVEDKCLSFCTIVFLAGYNRYGTPTAIFGFHAPSLKGASQLDDELNTDSKKLYSKLRVPKEFINKIYATPNSDMWYPSYKELQDAGIVNRLLLGGESNTISKSFNKPRSELRNALASDKLFNAYEIKFPGFLDKVLDISIPMVRQGKSDDEILNAIRGYAATLQTKAIAMSTPEIRARFVKLGVKQAKEVSKYGGEACYKLLMSTINIYKVFPKEMVNEEIALTTDALSSSFVKPQNYSQGAFDSITPSLFSSMTPAEVSAISEPNQNQVQSTCPALIKFYEALDKLPSQNKDIAVYGLLKG